MNTTYLDRIITTGHADRLGRTADASRLAALARCCRPSAGVSAVRRAAARLREVHPVARPCCA